MRMDVAVNTSMTMLPEPFDSRRDHALIQSLDQQAVHQLWGNNGWPRAPEQSLTGNKPE